MKRYTLSEPHMGGAELEYVRQAFADNWVGPLGPYVENFELALQKRSQMPHVVATSSGTAAIHIALKLAGVDMGHQVFCSSLTFIASANPILYCGARPIFIDCEKDTLGINPQALELAIKEFPHVRHLVLAHIYGLIPQMQAIIDLCERNNITIIEDAAEALGSHRNQRPAGNFSNFGAYSFNGNKIITTGGGGALLLNDPAMAEKAVKLITQARDKALYYEHSEMGFNYRMSSIAAAIGLGQLEVLDSRIKRKNEIFEYYQKKLGAHPSIQFPKETLNKARESNAWLSCALFDYKAGSLDLCEKLISHKIEARPFWKPMHLQPLFKDDPYICLEEDVSKKLFQTGLCLPSSTTLSDEDLDFICKTILSYLPN